MTTTTTAVRVLAGVHVPGHDGPVDVTVRDGAVVDVVPAAGASAGRVVLPGLVDAHVHLDKAYLLGEIERAGASADGDLASALAVTARLREELGPGMVRPGMERLLTRMRAHGTVAARAHVEVGTGLDAAGAVALHREVLADHVDVHVQLCAFPQHGTSHDPGAVGWMKQAVEAGCAVVGGCPYADDDPVRHLDLVLGLAADAGLPVDLHLDLTDDPEASQLDLVLAAVGRHGLAGRVTVGHMTALSALPPDRLASAVAGLRDLDVAVVVIPTTDLWLSGRTPARPGVRGVAPVRALLDGGVRVALASNNHQNAFTPVGGGGLLRAAWLASLVCHVGDAAGQLRLLEAVTSTPAGILGLGRWDVAPGSAAPLLVVDADAPVDAVREAPAVLERVGGVRSAAGVTQLREEACCSAE